MQADWSEGLNIVLIAETGCDILDHERCLSTNSHHVDVVGDIMRTPRGSYFDVPIRAPMQYQSENAQRTDGQCVVDHLNTKQKVKNPRRPSL